MAVLKNQTLKEIAGHSQDAFLFAGVAKIYAGHLTQLRSIAIYA